MAETKRIKVLLSRGNPSGGPILRAGSVVEIAAFWADRWLADGTAELVTETAPAEPKEKKKNVKK